jgi:hypothetical protein
MESIPTHVLDSWILGSQIVLNLVEVGEYSLSLCPYRCLSRTMIIQNEKHHFCCCESANEFLPLELLTCWQQQLTTDKPRLPYKRTYLHYTVRCYGMQIQDSTVYRWLSLSTLKPEVTCCLNAVAVAVALVLVIDCHCCCLNIMSTSWAFMMFWYFLHPI